MNTILTNVLEYIWQWQAEYVETICPNYRSVGISWNF